jgi:hypothetical protein
MDGEPPPGEIGRQDPSSQYQGPGLWEGCFFIVPVTFIVALASTIGVAIASGNAIESLIAGLGGLIAGVVAWLTLWELFVQLHPRFSAGAASALKYYVVVLGPFVITCVVVVAIAGVLR